MDNKMHPDEHNFQIILLFIIIKLEVVFNYIF